MGQSGNIEQGHGIGYGDCFIRERSAPEEDYDLVGERVWKVHLLLVDASKSQMTQAIDFWKAAPNLGR